MKSFRLPELYMRAAIRELINSRKYGFNSWQDVLFVSFSPPCEVTRDLPIVVVHQSSLSSRAASCTHLEITISGACI